MATETVAETYMRRADEARARADSLHDDDARAAMIRIAEVWERMAHRVQRLPRALEPS